jgi:hypothetical protein
LWREGPFQRVSSGASQESPGRNGRSDVARNRFSNPPKLTSGDHYYQKLTTFGRSTNRTRKQDLRSCCLPPAAGSAESSSIHLKHVTSCGLRAAAPAACTIRRNGAIGLILALGAGCGATRVGGAAPFAQRLANFFSPMHGAPLSSQALKRAVPGGTEQYVRLRAGRDGGEFVVPAHPLCGVSVTMAGMLRGGANFVEEQALLSVSASEGAEVSAAQAAPAASSACDLKAGAVGGGASATAAKQDGHGEVAGGVRRRGVIAVDGPAASGKGTLSRALAAEFGFAHLDTGALYRATALRMLRKGAALDGAAPGSGILGEAADEARLIGPADLSAPELREERVGQGASVVSADARVRAALLELQRDFCRSPPGGAPGAVLDGRDIGTVVWPEAPLKVPPPPPLHLSPPLLPFPLPLPLQYSLPPSISPSLSLFARHSAGLQHPMPGLPQVSRGPCSPATSDAWSSASLERTMFT